MTALQLEICAETLQACVAARQGGANRIELCSGLVQGGVTPSHGLIRRAILESKLPVHVMLRPRSGNFVYSASEFGVICSDLEHAAQLGAAGVVCGMLHENNTVDQQRTAKLVRVAGPMEVTFHRAFDEAPDLPQALEELIACGCGRVLTSGGKRSAAEGQSTLAALAEQAQGRIRIAAGGGITIEIAARLLAHTRLDLHTSLRRRLVADADADLTTVPGGELPLELQASDVRSLAALLASAGRDDQPA
jgi:copper homeostasis protein